MIPNSIDNTTTVRGYVVTTRDSTFDDHELAMEMDKARAEVEAMESYKAEERQFDKGVERAVMLKHRHEAQHHRSCYRQPSSYGIRGARGAYRAR